MKTALLEELALSESIVRKGVDVMPRFRVTTPDGEYRILMPLPDDIAKRERGMHLMAAFMAWKQASAFILASELKEPDAIVAFAACRDGHAAVMRLIRRKPLSFGDNQWLEESQIGFEVVALLPSGSVSIDRETEADLKRLFGEGGEYQARKLNWAVTSFQPFVNGLFVSWAPHAWMDRGGNTEPFLHLECTAKLFAFHVPSLTRVECITKIITPAR